MNMLKKRTRKKAHPYLLASYRPEACPAWWLVKVNYKIGCKMKGDIS